MGVALYVCSTSHFSGKTAVCVGLGRRLLRDGLHFGYVKPLSVVSGASASHVIDEDAALLATLSGVEPPLDPMVPVRLATSDVGEILASRGLAETYLERVREACERTRRDSDVVLLEGGGDLAEGAVFDLAAGAVTKALRARALVVVRYATDLQLIDDVLLAQSILGEALLGVVLNAVPGTKKSFVVETVIPTLRSRGIHTYAVLPHEHILGAINVSEIVEALTGTVLCAQRNQHELVENLMVGAMNATAALSHFRRKPNKAVFTGGDRLDIQLAALETSTRCLVLTGGLQPSSITLGRAEEVGVPVISVTQDTLAAIEIIEASFGKTRFHQEQKIAVFERLMDELFDFESLYASLGLA